MGGIPDIMFVIDTNKEAIAIQEARKLNIPIIAILDTNCDPDGITYPIPGNDDAARAIQTYCDLIADAVLDGLASGAAASGIDLGASEAPVEPMLREAEAPKAEAEAAPAGTEGVAAEMEAAQPAVADDAAKEANTEANDAVETEKATG
jgi:small subunit ribosomal protein S2